MPQESLGQFYVSEGFTASPGKSKPIALEGYNSQSAFSSRFHRLFHHRRSQAGEHRQGRDLHAIDRTSNRRPATFVSPTSGVGALPGSQTESRVAVPPDARQAPSTDKDLPAAPAQKKKSGSSGVTTEPTSPDKGRGAERSVSGRDDVSSSSDAAVPSEDESTHGDHSKDDENKTKAPSAGADAAADHGPDELEGEKKSKNFAKDGYGEGYHPAEILSKDDQEGDKGESEERRQDGQGVGGLADSKPTGMSKSKTGSSGGSDGGKATLKDKLKGEAKILVGKLSHNEDKVEEGKKLKTGST